VEIRLSYANGTGISKNREKTFLKALAKAGFVRPPPAPPRFTLDMTVHAAPLNAAPLNGAPPQSQGFTVLCELTDTQGLIKPLRHITSLKSLSRADIRAFARTLGQWVFRVEG
jgi:hypothetical protein